MESTFVMIKPDGIRNRLMGEIIGRFERRGFTVEAMRMDYLTTEIAETHYGEHLGKNFFRPLVDYVTSGPVLLMIVTGIEGTVNIVRDMIGATDPVEATPGTIRGDFATEVSENVIHGSDSVTSAGREIELFFPDIFKKEGDGDGS